MKIENLKFVRKSRGLTQRELGERMGTIQSRISSIETGLNVSPALAQRFADVLMCDVSELRTPDEPTLTFKVSELPAEVLALLKK
ncbi:MAG TPA: helix-turn-helix transcriptional regulator [Rubrobacter sp.]|nr:helix-turn-helix transcriptional regulator [Rubrobacter sp.]